MLGKERPGRTPIYSDDCPPSRSREALPRIVADGSAPHLIQAEALDLGLPFRRQHDANSVRQLAAYIEHHYSWQWLRSLLPPMRRILSILGRSRWTQVQSCNFVINRFALLTQALSGHTPKLLQSKYEK